MEGGLPMLNCLLQHTLRSLCSCPDSSHSSKWVYAVFWRILPRNYPPPKWDYGGSALDRSKGNKRNWILVWEEGYCDFYECLRGGSGYSKGRFGADLFFKMTHEVYNYGEGVLGKVAADNSHKWLFRESPNESDSRFVSSWNMSIEPLPRAWQFQFNSGIQTIAVISVREGIIQLGSFEKIMEDLTLVINIQRKMSYLQSIPGVFAIQRPYLPIQHPYMLKPNTEMIEYQKTTLSVDDKQLLSGSKRLLFDEKPVESPIKSINLGWNSPQNGWTIPPHLPTMPCTLGAVLSKLPSAFPFRNATEASDTAIVNNSINGTCHNLKVNDGGLLGKGQISDMKPSCYLDAAQEQKPTSINLN
ncbi:bHLH-MYC_N domain-containing protein [Cephalotus follicularis]|uniref:BHLH-MYC_N domain-containing protein n=1 Tax=Cephalotus follicularis TaxID=3775 RepID=A0A1Q3CUW9_CEPFO|nr:bHLH-MYC_N domain-containing protein [Cephalotus follicularis]